MVYWTNLPSSERAPRSLEHREGLSVPESAKVLGPLSFKAARFSAKGRSQGSLPSSVVCWHAAELGAVDSGMVPENPEQIQSRSRVDPGQIPGRSPR